jgi:hypothetical protein
MSRRGVGIVNVLRFSVEGEVAEAVKVRSLQDRARAVGVRHVRFTYTFTGLRRSERREFHCHIACSGQMAVFLIAQLRLTEREAEQRGDARIAEACRRATGETFAVLMNPGHPPATVREARDLQLAGER